MQSNTTNAINDQATQAGAFGGSRQGVAQGVALANMNQDQANQMAQLQYGGYNDTMNRAQGLAGLGFGANQQMAGLGDYMRQVQQQQDPLYHKYDVLNQGIRGLPYGQTNTQSSSSPWGSQIAGGVMQLGGAALAGGF